jgi:hypothetical protein
LPDAVVVVAFPLWGDVVDALVKKAVAVAVIDDGRHFVDDDDFYGWAFVSTKVAL